MSTVLTESFFNVIERKGDCLDSITYLIKQGIDINTTFKAIINGIETTQSLLSFACYQNCTKIAKMLIDRGANVNFKTSPEENTPMHIACLKHNKEIVSFLLQIPSITLNSLNQDNELCFSIALKTSQTEIYSMIINTINAQKVKALKQDHNHHHNNCLNIKDMRKSLKCNNYKLMDNIEIPFLFQDIDKSSCANSLNGFIRLAKTPSLMIDMDSLEKSEMIKTENKALKERVLLLEKELQELSNENTILKKEVGDLNALLKVSKEEISSLKSIALTTETTIINPSNHNHSNCNNNDCIKEDSSNAKCRGILNYSIDETDNYLQTKFQSNKQSLSVIKSSLQKDLIDYRDYIKLNISKSQDIIQEIVYQLQYAVDELSLNYEVTLYGSRATQLCLIWSDLDVVITEKEQVKSNNTAFSNQHNNQSNRTHINPFVLLDLLSISLSAKLWVSSLKYISTAKIPIIKLTTTEKYSSMQIDISIQDGCHCGIKCVELVNSYIKEYWVLEPLVLAIKTILKLASLNDPFTGGLSSYGVILMLVNYLKNERMLNRPIDIENIADLLCDFLLYYGSMSETNFVNVSNVNISWIPSSPFELVIVDPLNINNNVAKSTFHYFNIKIAFLLALQALSEECPCGCHYTINSNNCLNESLQHNVLKKMFNAVKRGNHNILNNI